MAETRVAVMQPYVFPYLGYFQLIRAVDEFIFFDDVNFIKRGWINRNRIKGSDGSDQRFTIPLKDASQNRMIKEIQVNLDDRSRGKLLKSIDLAYRKAPNHGPVLSLINDVFNAPHESIADLAIVSVRMVHEYLGLQQSFHRSSLLDPDKEVDGPLRVLDLSLKLGATQYINAPGGRDLYDSEDFAAKGVKLSFIESELPTYPQGRGEFIPGLSIIDVLMYNPLESVVEMMGSYQVAEA